MGQDYKYVSLDRIFSKLVRDFGEEFNEGDVVEWCGEALEFIGAKGYYEEAVAFIEVKNHQCELPAGLHNIIQIARNNKWSGYKDDDFCPKIIQESLCEVDEDCDCSVDPGKAPDYIILDCNGQPLNDYDVAYYRPYFDLRTEYFGWKNCSAYHDFTPVRLSTNSFFNSIVCTENESENIYKSSIDEYTIIRGEIVRFSFREGSVAIAYNRQVRDLETGYPLVPDNISYTTAITKYVTLKIMERQFYNGREGAVGKMQKAEADWHWYCKQASNIDMMPYGEDQHQNLLDQRSYMLPRNGSYYSFFGRMARPEQRPWNDPDGRNRGFRNFIGN